MTNIVAAVILAAALLWSAHHLKPLSPVDQCFELSRAIDRHPEWDSPNGDKMYANCILLSLAKGQQ